MTNKIRLSGEKETLFMTLYAKAEDSRSPYSILHDKTAEKILNNVDYDFSKVKQYSNNLLVVRALRYDRWTENFIKKYPDAVVIHAGCGLDTRISRINLNSNTDWYDVDYPEVIELRREFYKDKNGYSMIGSSLTDPRWHEQIPAGRPTLIVAEGVLEYLEPGEVKSLLNRLISHFGHGQILFDIMSPFAVESARKNLEEKTGAVHKWAVGDLSEIDKLNPQLNLIEEFSLFKLPDIAELPFRFRMTYRIMSLIPKFRDMMRLVCYEF